MRKLLLAGVAMTALFGGSAMAADLAVRPAPVPYRAPPPVYIFSWTGCYVGGNVGGVWVKKDYSLTGTGVGLSGHTADSWLGGAQAGCNYQVGGWVFGIQGDYDWTNATASHVDPIFLATQQSKTKSLASVTGRVGYTWDRLLGYVKGGGAWETDDYTITTASSLVASASETRSGWTVGVGLEYAFTNWLSGFVEYDYYGFGTKSVTFLTPAVTGIDIKESKNVVKVGLNFRFGGWGPGVASY